MLGDLAFRIVSTEERNLCLVPWVMSGAARRKKSETLSKTALGNDCLTEVAWNLELPDLWGFWEPVTSETPVGF